MEKCLDKSQWGDHRGQKTNRASQTAKRARIQKSKSNLSNRYAQTDTKKHSSF